MNADLDSIAFQLTEGDDPRQTMVEILSRGLNLPPLVKQLAYISIMQMSDEKLSEFRGYALQAIEFAKNQDLDGLEKFLLSNGVPAPMVALIKPYVIRPSKD